MSQVFYPQCHAVLNLYIDDYQNALSGKEVLDNAQKLVLPCRPVTATVHLNSYNQADSWDITVMADDLPIDPQYIRAGSVEVYLYQTQGLSPGLKLRPRQSKDAKEQGDSEAGRSTRKTDIRDPEPMVAGLIDEVTLELSSERKEVTLSGQDYTAYLMERQFPPTSSGRPRRIPVGKRIDYHIEEWLKEADPTGTIKLDVVGVEKGDLPTVQKNEVRSNKRGIPVEEDTSYWDIIYGTATRHGMIAFVRGTRVILTRPQIFATRHRQKPIQFAWGPNIESLSMSRSMGKERVPQIIMKGYDHKKGETVVVKFPKKRQPSPAGTLGVKKDEFKIVPAYGISDPEILRNAAEQIFHLIGSAERKVVMTVTVLRDGADNDVLAMKPGELCLLDFAEFNVNHALLNNPDVPPGRKAAHLVSRGWSFDVANAIALNYEKLRSLKRPLRIREVSYNYDLESGVQAEIELVDFVVVDGIRDIVNKAKSEERRGRAMK